jgi:hypothetical protein
MVKANFSSLKEAKPHEYAVRFLFGGICTVLAGLIAKHFGPGIGGLFLAFPAIFPASATLIESHEKERKAKVGSDGRRRGRMAASIDSAGTALGCVGLVGFACIIWKGLTNHNGGAVIVVAGAAWMLIACALWALRRSRLFGHRDVF